MIETAPVVLASSSPYRLELLTRLGISPVVRTPEIDEHIRVGEDVQSYVKRLALAKAKTVVRTGESGLFIGADQSAILNGNRLEKPGSFTRVISQLESESNREVMFWTSVAVVSGSGTCECVDAVSTKVTFRKLTSDEIRRYAAKEAPLDCAGGFKAEGLGITLFRAVESSDPTAVIGLPLIRLSEMLRDCGLALP